MKLPLWLVGLFNKAIAGFKALFSMAFPAARMIIMGALKDIALEAVKEMRDTENLTNEEKRKGAFNRIEAYAKAEGIEARAALINTLVEMAYLAIIKDEE